MAAAGKVNLNHGEHGGEARWAFIEAFRWVPAAEPAVSWDGALPLIQAAHARHRSDIARLATWLADSDAQLQDLGGDPLREQWSAFRPLRLSREEDWSDWLAHLIRTSRTGTFLSAALRHRFAPATLTEPLVAHREWVLPGGYRADLGVLLQDGSWMHIEVKVGDTALEKTAATGLAMSEQVQPATVHDVLLLPPDDRYLWDVVREAMAKDPTIPISTLARTSDVTVIDWRDIARGLRRGLNDTAESMTWRALAVAFCGAVEQSLLGIACLRKEWETALSFAEVERLVQYQSYLRDDE
jgi:hypothetical protein